MFFYWRAFISADKDFDGKVDESEFEGMISAAAAFPQKFGFEFWKNSGKDQFAAIDENGDGAVSFDEWLGFAYGHYKAQVQTGCPIMFLSIILYHQNLFQLD